MFEKLKLRITFSAADPLREFRKSNFKTKLSKVQNARRHQSLEFQFLRGTGKT